MKALLLLFFVPFILATRLAADPAPEAGIPAEMLDIFRGSRPNDGGWIDSDDGRGEELAEYIRANWRYLMTHIGEVPTKDETTISAIALIGQSAEELPPEEYLDFLDAFLSLYSEGLIPDNILMYRLFGMGRKNFFISVNSAHPRVQGFLERTKELVPKENEKLHSIITDLAKGEGSDMYYANASENDLPPETLPGIKLRRPFESMIPEFMREKREQRESSRRLGKEGSLDPGDNEPADRSRVSLAAAIAAVVALFCVGMYLVKLRKAAHG